MTVDYTPPFRRKNHGRGHSYEDALGRKVPGVTTVLKVLPAPGLIKWSAQATADYALDNWRALATSTPSQRHKMLMGARYETLNKASARGTTVHRLADKLVRGAEVVIPEGLEAYVNAYVRFLDEHDVQPLHVELLVASTQDPVYAGTLDLIAWLTADFGDGPFRALWLLDIKTGNNVYGEAALQLAAYRYASEMRLIEQQDVVLPMPEVDQVGVVHLRPTDDGRGVFRLVPVKADIETWEIFAKTYQLYQEMQETNDLRFLVGEPALPAGGTETMRLVPVQPEATEGAAE